MRSRYRVSLGGIQMDSLNNNLLIHNVEYSPIEYTNTTFTIAGQDGYEISNRYLQSRKVTVTFELHIYDIAARQAACQDVVNWAKAGGNLTVNDRKNQRLAVRCSKLPVIDSVRDWTAPLTIEFETTSLPYWEETTATTNTVTGTSTYTTASVPGNAGDTYVAATIKAEAAITSLELETRTADSAGTWKTHSLLKLTGITIPKNGTVTISYTNKRYLRIRDQNGASLLAKVDKSSTDRLKATCGEKNRIYIKASAKVSATFTIRGIWL